MNAELLITEKAKELLDLKSQAQLQLTNTPESDTERADWLKYFIRGIEGYEAYFARIISTYTNMMNKLEDNYEN